MNPAAALLASVEIGDPLKIGGLALFPLYHERPPAPSYITGPRAGDRLRVSEVDEGVVEELELTNDGDLPILLIDGESLLGGLQNRIITTSVLLPSREPSLVSVTCVEAGRWGDRRPVARSPRSAPSAVRARNLLRVNANVAAGGAVENDQAGVWEEVATYALLSDTQSPTSAMEDVHDHIASEVEAMVGHTRPRPHQRGVVVAACDRILALDLFDSRRTLKDYWPALVAGYALDGESRCGSFPKRREVRKLLGNIAAGRATELDGRVHIVGDRVAATALLLEGTVVHLAATVDEVVTTVCV